MQRITSQNLALTTAAPAAQVSLPLSSLNEGRTSSYLYLRLSGLLTLPVIAAGNLEPEHVTQCIRSIQLQYGKGSININGDDLDRYMRARWAIRSGNNNRTYPQNAATQISHVLAIPLNPSICDIKKDRAYRIPSIMLRGQQLQCTVDFGALAADFTSFAGTIEVWANAEDPIKDGSDGTSPMFINLTATADLNGSELAFPRADLIINSNTNAYTEFRVDNVVQTNITPALHAQFKRWEHAGANGYRYDETRTSLVDPALYLYPLYVAGVRTTPQMVVFYDRRDYKNPGAGAFVRLENRNANLLPVVTEYGVS